MFHKYESHQYKIHLKTLILWIHSVCFYFFVPSFQFYHHNWEKHHFYTELTLQTNPSIRLIKKKITPTEMLIQSKFIYIRIFRWKVNNLIGPTSIRCYIYWFWWNFRETCWNRTVCHWNACHWTELSFFFYNLSQRMEMKRPKSK